MWRFVSFCFSIFLFCLKCETTISQVRDTCLFSICGVCEIAQILACFNSGFSFFQEKCSSSSTLFGLKFRVLRNFHTSNLVGFEFFSQECPSISFFFARLGVFLEYSSSQCPQVGLFASCFTTLKPVLLSLYPLIIHSLIKRHLEMTTIEYREDDVRSSELETGLSSNAESLCKVVDIVASKLPSTSSLPPLHSLSEICSLKDKQMGLGKDYSFPKVPPLDCLVLVKKLVTLPMEKCASTRLTFYVVFTSLSIRLLCNFCIISKLPLVNSSLTPGGRL